MSHTPADTARVRQRAADGPALKGDWLALESVGAALAMCSSSGELVAASPSCRALLNSARLIDSSLPVALPSSLWSHVVGTPLGEALQWRSEAAPDICLGMTAYRAGDEHLMLIMREITTRHRELARRLHEQRLMAIGRMVAGITHDLRAPLASIVFAAHVTAMRCGELSTEEMRESMLQINAAAQRLQATISGMLQYARIGPSVEQIQPMSSVVSSATNLLRHTLRAHGHTIRVVMQTDQDTVIGNRLMIEQILVNLFQNAIEAATGVMEIVVRIEASEDTVSVHVIDDGPGMRAEVRSRVFEPFYTTKSAGTGLGLTMAREAAGELGGELTLRPSARGAHFVLRIRRAQQDSVSPPNSAPGSAR